MKDLKPVTIDAFCGFTFLSNVAFSPEGGSAAFTLTRANLKKNGYDSWLWLRRDGKNSRLTGLGKEHDFVWLDEKTIAFAGDREQRGAVKGTSIETKYYKIRIDGGEA
ncbi:MAG: S9 family peptidase, partial [Clostridia bacterium]|nr:S9 family peptidase [Clostridia bacterium]